MAFEELQETSNHRFSRGKKRPPYLRALGQNEPPLVVSIDGKVYQQLEIFKHDSWAATATYSDGESIVVCKFNREASFLFLPMRWLGRWLGQRETYFLKRLEGVPGIPKCYGDVRVDGKRLMNATSHAYIPGEPLSLANRLRPDFFEKLEAIICELHARRIAYVDLHKAENIIVCEDGLPYLIDFQISLTLVRYWGLDWLFKFFASSDLYHLEKHQRFRANISMTTMFRPWWIRWHRRLTIPIRSLRRRFLVCIGVRRGVGYSFSENTTEVGLRK